MSLAAETRDAARAHPFLVAALRAGVLNYAAAARFLDVSEDEEAVSTALRRFADDLPDWRTEERPARVTMEAGLGEAGDDEDPLLTVGGTGFAPDAGSLTGVLATGAVDAGVLAAVLDRLGTAGVAVEAAGVAGDALLVVVERREGANAVRAVEAALDGVPTDD